MKLVVLSHGGYGHGLLDICRMIMGDVSDILTLSLSADQGVAAFEVELASLIQNMHGPYLILCDLFGGTPFNSAVRMAHGDIQTGKCQILTGVNAPMLLELVSVMSNGQKMPLEELKCIAIYAGQEGIRELYNSVSGNDEDEIL